MNLNLLNYNNYYNREVKKFDTLAEYEPYILDVVENLNFNPGDGVDTSQIVNYSGDITPNYAIVDDGVNIVSRWFIIDADFVRRGQYDLTLHRDLVADNYNAVVNAPCFIEKATLDDNDIGIYNQENIKVNQIKQSETLLKDETGTGWVVGYIPSNAFPPKQEGESQEDYDKRTTVETSFVDSGTPDIIVNGIENWEYYNFTDKSRTPGYAYDRCLSDLSTVDMIIELIHDAAVIRSSGERNHSYKKCKFRFDNTGHIKPETTGYDSEARTDGKGNYRYRRDRGNEFPDPWNYNLMGWVVETSSNYNFDDQAVYILKAIEQKLLAEQSQIQNAFDVYFDDVKDWKTIPRGTSLEFLQGKTIYDSNTHILYKIDINKTVIENKIDDDPNIPFRIRPEIDIDVPAFYPVPNVRTYVAAQDNTADVSDTLQYSCTLTDITLTQQKININCKLSNSSERNHLVDAPYDMFCVPYNEDFQIKIGSETINNKRFAAINTAVAIGAKLGSDTVYDIQLLPYCPMRNAITEDGHFDVTNIPHDIVKAPGLSGTKYSVIIWCDRSNFTFDIEHTINVTNKKESNCLELYRLCAPNYGSAFDFSPAKNNGITKFNIDASYKPFNPYIHVNPDFKGLYGADFNDVRGLVCGGDYSLTQLTSAWADYELRNKNYQNSFNLQIETLDKQHEIDEQMANVNAITGIVQAGVMGGVMGGSVGKGGPVAKTAGGLISAGISAWGASKDKQIREAQFQLNKGFLQDQFKMNLENIQAIPYAISKTSTMTINNKIFPFIEHYTCSNEEKVAFENKLKYTGMTVNRIGKIADFIKDEPTFIKGQLIKIHNLDEDFHAANSIASEIDKGIYI